MMLEKLRREIATLEQEIEDFPGCKSWYEGKPSKKDLKAALKLTLAELATAERAALDELRKEAGK